MEPSKRLVEGGQVREVLSLVVVVAVVVVAVVVVAVVPVVVMEQVVLVKVLVVLPSSSDWTAVVWPQRAFDT